MREKARLYITKLRNTQIKYINLNVAYYDRVVYVTWNC